MLFNSYIFILVFLPICLVGYFFINKKYSIKTGLSFLVVLSLFFYGYNTPQYTIIIVFSILVNYVVYYVIHTNRKSGHLSVGVLKLIVCAAIFINLGILAYFKYLNFSIQLVNDILGLDLGFLNILMPLGISFFTFQQLSFIVDTYKGEVGDYSFVEYACYVSFFPQLIAGPIVTHNELIPQLCDSGNKKVDWDNISSGLYIFIMGLGKKVLLADILGSAVNVGYDDISSLNSIEAIVIMISYTMQIYFDFSGYSDMAIGIAKMFNIDLPINFNLPYKATSIKEFWERWHMTLTRFFTRYVYIPMGGNRKGKIRTYLNILVIFLLSGIWHGAGYTYIIWGLIHGVCSVLNRCCSRIGSSVPKAIKWLVTFGVINISWIFFRADSLNAAIGFIRQIFMGGYGSISYDILEKFTWSGNRFCTASVYNVALFLGISFILSVMPKQIIAKRGCKKFNLFNGVLAYIVCMMCIVSFSDNSIFLYWNF